MKTLSRLSPFLLLAGLLGLPGCHDRSSGDGDAGPGSLELRGDDVTQLENHFAALRQTVLDLRAFVPGLKPGGERFFDDPCQQADEDLSGSDYHIAITWTGCEVQSESYGNVTLDGSALLSGSLRPDPYAVEKALADIRLVLPDIDRLLFDAGLLNALSEAKVSYDLTKVDGSVALRVPNGLFTLLHYERDTLLNGVAVMPYVTSEGARSQVHLTAYLDLGLPARDTSSPGETGASAAPELRGIVVCDLEQLGPMRPDGLASSDVPESVLFEFDGSSLVRFTMRISGRTGTLDLETGEVTFEP
ncbi:MAG: hypothetical protein AB1486_23270 [Planctomycetota bacterium]